ncbi:MAG: PP2C family protein-serine/threonine phosphatase [Janthinobacterium lividum]
MLHTASEDATLLAMPGAGAGAVDGVTHMLVMAEEGHARRQVALTGPPVTFGRAAPSDVLVDGGLVSRQHCRFELSGDQAAVVDLGSTNGTFVDGARIGGRVALQHGATVRVGAMVVTYERRTRRETHAAAAVERDLQGASAYVQMLLPKPLHDGPVRAAWLFLPSAQLGGNAFGYRFLDADRFAGYMLDVAGQGTGAAMHSVAVMNLLRQPEIPGVDLADPSAVLGVLNDMFRQEDHNGVFFLMWYFVLDLRTRRLRFASAGRHPGYLVAPGRGSALALGAEGPPVGLASDAVFATSEADAPVGSALCLLSDGASESLSRTAGFAVPGAVEALVGLPVVPGLPEPLRLYHAVRGAIAPDELDEDFSALVFGF